MDVAALSTSSALASVSAQVNVGLLKSAENLDKIVAAKLFGSLGLGNGIDSYA